MEKFKNSIPPKNPVEKRLFIKMVVLAYCGVYHYWSCRKWWKF